ncbi:hypothetical protein JKP88DRAFT_347378 [Tribonema minus]|uniref:Uncharacterized protein n=1 Tax=Tribonema minus TaxID=303371 RepID=A0A835ZFE9_9STRA|nr:hypothetical protein JKP88DRAFT_347378 [Tribonema minus]
MAWLAVGLVLVLATATASGGRSDGSRHWLQEDLLVAVSNGCAEQVIACHDSDECLICIESGHELTLPGDFTCDGVQRALRAAFPQCDLADPIVKVKARLLWVFKALNDCAVTAIGGAAGFNCGSTSRWLAAARTPAETAETAKGKVEAAVGGAAAGDKRAAEEAKNAAGEAKTKGKNKIAKIIKSLKKRVYGLVPVEQEGGK